MLAILFAALAAAAGVLLWRRWDWLALAAYALAAPQWIAYLFDGASSPRVAAIVLVAFGALGVAMAVGYDLRVVARGLRAQPAFLLALNAIVLAAAGWLAFSELGDRAAGQAWIVALAAAHAVVGLAGPRLTRVSHELRLLSLTLGVVLADVAFALLSHGWVLAVGWSAVGVAFAALQRHARLRDVDGAFAQGGLGAHLGLALVQTLIVAEPLHVIDGTTDLSSAGAAAMAALAAACLVAGRLMDDRGRGWRIALDVTGLAAVALLSALALDGRALALAWLGEALALAGISRRFRDVVAGWGSLGFLALATLHALAQEAPPASLAHGLASPLDALITLGGVAAVACVAAAWLPDLSARLRLVLRALAAVGVLYLASGLVVTPFTNGQAVPGLGTDQQAQLALSVFWAAVGLGMLVVGLRRDLRALRVGALALLGLTIAKVFLLDLATLTSVYRVGSFVALGLLLLAAAFVWQRLRPRERECVAA